mgnify:CR=1 FL=1
MTREEFFEKLNNGAKWDVGVAINRTNPVPLDANSVFESLDALTTYATTNALAYPGQVVSVLGMEEIAAYLIKTTGEGALISKLAASSTSGDIADDVAKLQTQVANIINGTQVVGAATKATQDGEGNVISTTYATAAALDGVKTTAEKGVSDAAAAKTAADAAKEVADAKVGAVSLASGVANGTVKLTVDGVDTEVAVKGLGSAAYTAADAYDAAGTAKGLVDTHNVSTEAHSDIRESITALAEKVSGRATGYVFQNKSDPKYTEAIGKTGSFVIGDTIYFTDSNVVDQWVVAVNDADPFYTFQDIETEKPDLEGYVKDTRTINGKDLKTDIVLGVVDIEGAASKTDVSTAKTEVLGEVDTKLEGYVKTTELDGKGYITKDVSDLTNYTTTTALNGLLDGKQDKNTTLTAIAALTGAGLVKKTADGVELDTNAYITDAALADYAKSADVTQEINAAVADKQTAEQVNALIAAATIEGSKVNGAVAEATTAATANKVANALTIGSETYDGSAPVEVTAATLGALTEVPAATAEKIGGFKLISDAEVSEETATHRIVKLDAHDHAYVDIPAAMVYTAKADGGLELEDGAFGIKALGVKDSMIESVSTDKFVQGTNPFVLNGGNANA